MIKIAMVVCCLCSGFQARTRFLYCVLSILEEKNKQSLLRRSSTILFESLNRLGVRVIDETEILITG